MKKFFPNIQYPISNIILIFLLFISFFYRVYGLADNHSFWSDEAHVAIFARVILERGRSVLANGYSTGVYQWLQYWLSATSAKVFGLNEFAIRFPSIAFGVLTIWAIYLLGKELFSDRVGLVAAFLTTFLKIEILWSRQARPYQALQFFYVLSAYFVYKLAKRKKFNLRYPAGFLGSGVLASLMHGLGLLVFGNGFLYFGLFYFPRAKKWLKKQRLIFVVSISAVFAFSYCFRRLLWLALAGFGKANNLFYYRVFLWHNYSLLVFLALVGFLSLVFQKKKNWQILVLPLVLQGVIASFFLGRYVRYLYVVFPFLILLAAVGLVLTAQTLSDRVNKHQKSNIKLLTLLSLSFFIIAMGHKFTLISKRIYSLNEDMQEIPEVDWKKIYDFVEEKLVKNRDAVLVTNWNDLPVWFLGEGKLDYYLTRKIVREEIERDPLSSAILITSIDRFEKLVRNEGKGILVIDSWDDEVSGGIREYCRGNLKKELEVDRLYPVQPRYWPVEVYSWGI